jgi:hypothetical protein
VEPVRTEHDAGEDKGTPALLLPVAVECNETISDLT